jgi:ketosteroid isomerase-like protein
MKGGSTMSDANVKTIQTIYGAFGRGDIPTILASVTDDTEWTFNGAQPKTVPWHEPYRGKGALPKFFAAMSENLAIEAFEPRAFIGSGDQVVVHVRIAYTVRKTNRRVDEEQLHWWTLAGGKVRRLIHFEDTRQVTEACAAS